MVVVRDVLHNHARERHHAARTSSKSTSLDSSKYTDSLWPPKTGTRTAVHDKPMDGSPRIFLVSWCTFISSFV